MNEFKLLVDIIEKLLGPEGCPWDREQTLQSLRSSIVEETFEVIEAIDLDQNHLIEEEVGDLLLNVIFICKVAEKEKRFYLESVLSQVAAKLVRRHPHVFKSKEFKTTEEVLNQWNQIKREERGERQESLLDGIPKDLPSIAKAQKMIKRLSKVGFKSLKNVSDLSIEEQAGEQLLKTIEEMSNKGIQVEHALRKRLAKIEQEFREWETFNRDKGIVEKHEKR